MAESNLSLFAGSGVIELDLRAIFRDELARGLCSLENCQNAGRALLAARDTLEDRPGSSAVVVINANDIGPAGLDDEIAAARRMLTRASRTGWHYAVATPDIDAWILADPAVRAAFEAMDPVPPTRQQRAYRIGEVAASRPIDREAIARAHPDFAALAGFIATHSRASEAVA